MIVVYSNVLPHAEIGKQRQILINHLDPMGDRGRWRQFGPRLAAQRHRCAHIRAIDARDNFDQRRLPATVLPGQAVHFSGHKVDADIIERAVGVEGFADVSKGKERFHSIPWLVKPGRQAPRKVD